MMVNYHLTITGRVQGVGFRGSTMMVARRLNVEGFVKNQVDGSVYVEVQGSQSAVKSFIDKMCASPTPYARVDHVDIKQHDLSHYDGFDIRF